MRCVYTAALSPDSAITVLRSGAEAGKTSALELANGTLVTLRPSAACGPTLAELQREVARAVGMVDYVTVFRRAFGHPAVRRVAFSVFEALAVIEEHAGVGMPGCPWALSDQLAAEALRLDPRTVLARTVVAAIEIADPQLRERKLLEAVLEWLSCEQGVALELSPEALARVLVESIEKGER